MSNKDLNFISGCEDLLGYILSDLDSRDHRLKIDKIKELASEILNQQE